MKNVSKLLLLVFLAGAGYFFGIIVYGADCPNVFGSFICNPTNVCNNPGSTCLCNAVVINHGTTCSTSIDPTADGVTGSVTNGNVCGDADGCMCGSSFVTKGSTCSIVVSDITAPTLVGGSVSIAANVASFPFTCSEGNVKISCLGSCGSCSLTANTGNNTVSFTLANGTYGNCSLIGQDSAGNVSSSLNIPSFTVNYTAGGGSTTSYGGGGGGTPICYDSDLVCVNGKYEKKSNVYCAGGNYEKICTVTTITTGTLYSLIQNISGLTESGFIGLLETVKTKNSTLYEYNPQGVAIKIYVPKYGISLIKQTILTLNNRLISAINKKIINVTDPSYMIENYQNLSVDSKIVMYKQIGSLTKTYNDFLAVLYMVLDMKKKDFLPIAKYYLEMYFKEFASFQK